MEVYYQIMGFFLNFWKNYGVSIILSILTIILGYLFLKFFKMLILRALKRINIKDRFILSVVKKVLNIGGWMLIGFLVLRSFNVSVSSVLIALSPMFLTIGLGFKNVISNFIKGMQLKILNPYAVGDVIEVDGIRGKVERIDFLYTYLHTKEGGFTTIANSQIADKRISNYTKTKSLIENFNFDAYREETVAKMDSSVKKTVAEETEELKKISNLSAEQVEEAKTNLKQPN